MIFAVRRLSRNGLKAWEKAVARGFEGLVAKNPESRYVPGRTLAWLKVKQPRYRERRGRRRASPSPPSQADVSSTRWPPCHSELGGP